MCASASVMYHTLPISSASLVYTLDHVTSRLVGDIFSCFFLKVPRAANGQFTYAYQESLRKVRVSRRVSISAPTVRTLNSTIGPDHDLSQMISSSRDRSHSSMLRALRQRICRGTTCLINRSFRLRLVTNSRLVTSVNHHRWSIVSRVITSRIAKHAWHVWPNVHSSLSIHSFPFNESRRVGTIDVACMIELIYRGTTVTWKMTK